MSGGEVYEKLYGCPLGEPLGADGGSEIGLYNGRLDGNVYGIFEVSLGSSYKVSTRTRVVMATKTLAMGGDVMAVAVAVAAAALQSSDLRHWWWSCRMFSAKCEASSLGVSIGSVSEGGAEIVYDDCKVVVNEDGNFEGRSLGESL